MHGFIIIFLITFEIGATKIKTECIKPGSYKKKKYYGILYDK